jgi:pantetheine-phosphate adenylyltransferase
LKSSLKDRPQVQVQCWEGLTVALAETEKAFTLIRGIRATSDFDYEFQMALTNRKLAPRIDTVFLMPSESHFYLSSRLIKEIAELGGNVDCYVPAPVAAMIKKRFSLGTAR